MEDQESEPNVAPNSVSNNFELQSNFVNAVFSLPELREMIISRAIYIRVNHQILLCRRTIPSLRHLSKDWFESVCKVLRKDKEPLFQLTVKKENSLNGTPYVQNEGGKLLDNFVNRVYLAPWYRENKPTFRLSVCPSFFRSQNYNSLLNLFLKCGENLVQLFLWIPQNGGSLVSIFPTLSLPSLQDIVVDHTSEVTIEPAFDEGEYLAESSLNITSMLNTLLNAGTSLKHFTIKYDIYRAGMPLGFPMLNFPTTVTHLDLGCEMTNEDLGILIKNRLPNLTRLYITVSELPFADGLLFQVLYGYKKTLEALHFYGNFLKRTPGAFTLIRFPEMQKLADLKFWGLNFQLEPELAPLQLSLPTLKALVLAQYETEFQNWAQYKFEGVEALAIFLCDPLQTSCDPAPISLENMQGLHQAFPYLQCLDLRMRGDQTCGIKYMFREMRQLKKLNFSIYGTGIYKTSDYWDALFTGVTVELITGLRLSPDTWETVSLENGDMPSIRMLTELESLRVSNDDYPRRNTDPLISDLTFIHAFLKMPKLRLLILVGRFEASSKMLKIWKSLGGNNRLF